MLGRGCHAARASSTRRREDGVTCSGAGPLVAGPARGADAADAATVAGMPDTVVGARAGLGVTAAGAAALASVAALVAAVTLIGTSIFVAGLVTSAGALIFGATGMALAGGAFVTSAPLTACLPVDTFNSVFSSCF